MLTTLTVAGWVAAALLLGLWWGERGRRLDVQRYARVQEPEKGGYQVVRNPASTDPEAYVRETLKAEEMEALIVDTIDETGCSREEAEREAREMLNRIDGASSELGVWTG